MILFFDTSALVKFFHKEEGTDVVVALISAPDNDIWVSELARLEFVSAVHRRLRTNEISEADLSKVLKGFYDEYSKFSTKKVGSAVLNEAEELIKRFGRSFGLRTLDAVHLATFSLFKELEDIVFVAADDILLRCAQLMGGRVINPCLGPSIIALNSE